MDDKIIEEQTHYSEKDEELEQFLIYLGLKDELFPHFLSRGLNQIHKMTEMDNFGINKNILTEQKKILILKNMSYVFEKIDFFYNNSKSDGECKEEIVNFSILDIIRSIFYEFEGIVLSKDLLIKGFKLKTKPNTWLPKHFQEKNILTDSISASILSSKKIISLEPLEGFKNLMYLYLNDNKIQKIENFLFLNLVYLDLSNNLIRKIENIDQLTYLEHLNLEKNCITMLENLSSNKNLEFLNMSKQSLTKRQCLIISDNFICNENKMKIILLEENAIFDIYPLKILSGVEKLTLQHNKLYEFNMIIDVLSSMRFLEILTLLKNPFIESFKNYRDIIILQNKNLKQFDDKTVTDNEKSYISSLFNLKYGKNQKEKQNFDKNINNDKNLEIKIEKLEITEETKFDNKLYKLDNQIFKRNKVFTHNQNKKK